ncbi:hypothetical protein PUN28_002313 [Cardiocondyla obscurior]|uniref:Ribosomal protein L20 n=1 Tax=Cardiocondyla obscurior TaxID=286306 RepID=A0AAW2GTL7_9HYME
MCTCTLCTKDAEKATRERTLLLAFRILSRRLTQKHTRERKKRNSVCSTRESLVKAVLNCMYLFNTRKSLVVSTFLTSNIELSFSTNIYWIPRFYKNLKILFFFSPLAARSVHLVFPALCVYN